MQAIHPTRLLIVASLAIVLVLVGPALLKDPASGPSGADAVTAATQKKPTAADRAKAEERKRQLEEQKRQQAEQNFDAIVAETEKAIDQADFASANRLTDMAARQAKAAGPASERKAEALRKELNTACDKALAEADADYKAGNYADALRKYQRLAAAVGDLPAGEQALRKLRAAEEDPLVRAAAREATAGGIYEQVTSLIDIERKRLAEDSAADGQPQAAPADIEVVQGMDPSKQGSILRNLQALQQQYADTEAGGKAVALLDAMTKAGMVEQIARQQEGQKAAKVFQLAESYEKAGIRDKAIEGYEQIVSSYPDSEYAAEAKTRLDTLKK